MTGEGWRRLWLCAAGIGGAAAVALGAYATHGLGGKQQALAETASRYLMYHSLALLFLAACAPVASRSARLAGLLFIAGEVFFAGSLTATALFAAPSTPLAPVGGSALILGWLFLALSAWKG